MPAVADDLHASVVGPGIERALAELATMDAGLESVRGTVLQAAMVDAGDGTPLVQEWFIQTGTGEILAFALPEAAASPPPRAGVVVVVRGRSIGMLESAARDGVVRRWPLWVGRPVSAVAATSNRMATIIVTATGIALGCWVVVRVVLRRRRSIGRDTVGSSRPSPSTRPSSPGGGDVVSLAAAVHELEESEGV